MYPVKNSSIHWSQLQSCLTEIFSDYSVMAQVYFGRALYQEAYIPG